LDDTGLGFGRSKDKTSIAIEPDLSKSDFINTTKIENQLGEMNQKMQIELLRQTLNDAKRHYKRVEDKNKVISLL
jgi:hypothetical protein